MRGQRADIAVELRGQAVQSVPGGGEIHPRRGVALARRQGHFAGQQQFAAADGRQSGPQPFLRAGFIRADAQAGRHPLDAVHGVAAPGHVQAENVAAAEGEAGRPRDDHGRRVMPGVTAAPFTQPQPVGELMALRDALGRRPPGEVEHLADLARQRKDHFQAVHHVGLAAGAGQCVPGAEHAARYRLDLGAQPQPGDGVLGLDAGPGAVVFRPGGLEARRPVTAGHRGTVGRVQAVTR